LGFETLAVDVLETEFMAGNMVDILGLADEVLAESESFEVAGYGGSWAGWA
jgi:hypothetical protein